jgi:lipopolysaccharide export system permease protein
MYADDIIGKGVETSLIVEMLFYVSIQMVPMALPLSVLLASIMTFGNLGENYELIACKASGISLFRVMKPLIIISIVLTGFAFVFSNNMVPYASLKGTAILFDIKRAKPESIIKEGVFTELQDYNIKVEKIDKTTGIMHHIIVYSHKNNKTSNNEVIVADSGRIVMSKSENIEFIFYSGAMYNEERKADRDKYNQAYSRINFSEFKMSADSNNSEFKRTDESLFADSYKMLNVSQLNGKQDTLTMQLNDMKSSLGKRTIAYEYFTDIDKSKIIKLDSLSNNGLSLDSLYSVISVDEKSMIMDMALRKARQLSSNLMNKRNDFSNQSEIIRRYEIEWHKKFTWSLACLIFFFIGAPLGGIIRKGGLGMPVVVSVLFFILYYIISMTGVRSAREGVFTSFEGVWLSTFIIVPIAIILTWQAVSDAPILNSDKYINFFRRFGLYKEKKVKDLK